MSQGALDEIDRFPWRIVGCQIIFNFSFRPIVDILALAAMGRTLIDAEVLS